MAVTSGPAVPWPLLLASTRPVLAWRPLAAAAAAAPALTALLAVLPQAADAVLPGLAVLVLACGLASAADDGTSAMTASSPVTIRRRLAARVVLGIPVSAAGLAGVVLVADACGAGPGWGAVRLWAALGALALAAGAVGSRSGLPGAVPAAVLLGAGLVLQQSLPEQWLLAAPWDSTGERLVLALGAAAAVLAGASRDPAAGRLGVRR